METPKFDVQRALAAMGDYPAMLRRFGVIRVLEIDLAGSGIDPATAGEITVSATPTWTKKLPAAQVTVVPVTVPAHLSATRFALTADGRIDPVAAKLEVSEVDTDSAAVRMVDLARQIVNAEKANADAAESEIEKLPPATLPEQMALPSLRNAGFSLAQGDRAVDLRSRLEAGKGLHTAATAQTLTDARQAVLGHVLDVWDDRTKKWHTVCARRGTYQLPGGKSFTLDDEGSISLAATAKEGATRTSPFYLHQSLVRWNGWSLVAPRPGKPVDTEEVGTEPKPPTSPALPGFSVSFEPRPGTLPRLRFGVGYRFQLRQVDIAGHADPLLAASTDFTRAVPASPIRYLRFDPVIAPVLVPDDPMTEGESVETLVIRPEPWLDGIIGSVLAPLLSNRPGRFVAPPKVSELLCEEHGRLDRADGTPDPSRYQMIAQRDAANLAAVGVPDPNRPGQRYLNRSTLDVTWLSDPISRGAAIAGLSGGIVKVRFDKTWPDVKAFRMQLADGSRDPDWNGLSRLLTLYVPRGETRTVKLSSFLDRADTDLMGQLGWLADHGAPANELEAARNDTIAGQAWQITPHKTLTLVNAVRVPLKAPTLPQIGADPAKPRTLGSTQQDLAATAEVHRPSTGILTLKAQWTDPIDDPDNPAGPTTRTSTATPQVISPEGKPIGELTIGYDPDPVTGQQIKFLATQPFGDTKRHKVSYSLVGTTRYMEYFVQRGRVTFNGVSSSLVAKAGIAPGTDTVRSADGKTTYRREVDYTVDYPAGTLKRVGGGAIPSGTPVEVAIVALPVSRPSSGKPVVVDLPSTARPMPPKVAWVVPTFGWRETSSDFGLTRTRTRGGGGLRIFLERGWWSSGEGEQLAVVLANSGAPTDPQLLPLLTQVGGDPTVIAPAPQHFPAPTDFPLAAIRRTELTPAELSAAKVAVAAHDVTWDAERSRWSCDVVLPPGMSYQPFISLALARYQDKSLAGVELSPVASVEWAQLVADRSATVVTDLLDLGRAKISVAGRSPSGNTVSVIVQSSTDLTPGDLDWQVAGPPDGQQLTGSVQPDGTMLWTGTITLPTIRLIRRYRLIVTENQPHPGGSRLVYTDVIRLS